MALADQSLRTGIRRVQQHLSRLGNSIDRAGKRSIKARPHLKKLGKTLEQVAVSGKKVQDNLRGVRVSFESTGRTSKRASKQVRDGTKQMELGLNNGRKSLARFSEALRTSIVNLRFLAVAFAGGALTGAVAKFGGEFEKSLTNIDTLLIDTTMTAQQFGDSLKGLAATTPKDLLDLSAALYQILSAGVPAANAMSVLESSTKLAISSISEVKDSANLLITTLNAYRASGLGAAEATDKLTRIYQLGRTTVGELAGSFGRVAPLAAQFGVDLDQVGGLMISLTRSGLRTNEAITATRAIISGIAKPTQKSQKILGRLGISFGQAAIDAHGFDGVMRNLLDTTGGNVDVLARLFPNIRALLPAVVTVGNGFGEFEENIRRVKDSFGATDEALAKSDDKFFKSAALLKSNFQNALVEIGEKVLPVLMDEFNKLSDTLNSETGQTFIEAISDILVVLVKLAFTFGEVLRNAILPFVRFFQSMDPQLLRVISTIVLANAVLRRFFITMAGSVAVTKLTAALKTIPAAFSAVMTTASTGGVAAFATAIKSRFAMLTAVGVQGGKLTTAGVFTGMTTGAAFSKIASGLSLLIGGAAKLFFGGFVIFTLVSSLADMIFGEAEREAEEAERKAKEETERKLREARQELARLERERRGGTAEDIAAKQADARVGKVIDLSNEDLSLLRTQANLTGKYLLEAERLVTVQQLYRDIQKGLVQELGATERTEEKLAEIRTKSLKLLEQIVRPRIAAGIENIAPKEEGVDLEQRISETAQKGRQTIESLNRQLVSAARSVYGPEGPLNESGIEEAGLILAKAQRDAIQRANDILADESIRITSSTEFVNEEQRAAALGKIKAQNDAFIKALLAGNARLANIEGSTASETFEAMGFSFERLIGQVTEYNKLIGEGADLAEMSGKSVKTTLEGIKVDPESFLFDQSILDRDALSEVVQIQYKIEEAEGVDESVGAIRDDLRARLSPVLDVSFDADMDSMNVELKARESIQAIVKEESPIIVSFDVFGPAEGFFNIDDTQEYLDRLKERLSKLREGFVKQFGEDVTQRVFSSDAFNPVQIMNSFAFVADGLNQNLIEAEKNLQEIERRRLTMNDLQRQENSLEYDNAQFLVSQLRKGEDLIANSEELKIMKEDITSVINEAVGMSSIQERLISSQRKADQKRIPVLGEIIRLVGSINADIDKGVVQSSSLVTNLSNALNAIFAQNKAQGALKGDKPPRRPGRGRGTNFQIRLEKALARLQEKTAKMNRRNLVEAQKIAEKTANLRIKSLNKEVKLIKELNAFYSGGLASIELFGQVFEIGNISDIVEAQIKNLLAAAQEAEKSSQLAREAGFDQRISNIKTETDESIKAEEKRLRANLKGNAVRGNRRKVNEKKIQDAIDELRKKSEAKRDLDIQKIEQLRQASREESESKLRKLRQDSAAVSTERLSAEIRQSQDSASAIQASIDKLNQTLEAPSSLNEKLRTMVSITSESDTQLLIQKQELELEKGILSELQNQEGKAEEVAKQKIKILGLTNKIEKKEAEISRSVASQLLDSLGSSSGVANELSAQSEALEELTRARQKSAAGADALGESAGFLDFNQRRMLESMDLLPSKMQEVRTAASEGILGRRGGFVSAFSTSLQNIVRSLPVQDLTEGTSDGFVASARSFGDSLLETGVGFVSEVGNGLLLSAKDFGPGLLAAADQFTLNMVDGLSGIAIGDMSFVTDAASAFATESAKILQDSTDVIGSALGTSIGSAFGDSDAGDDIGSEAGTMFGLAASRLIQGALSSVQRFVISPIQGAISAPFETLSSGIGSVFNSFLGDSAVSEESSRRRLELAEQEHALRIDQINKEAEDKAAQIDKDLSLTEDIAKIQELTAKREEVRQERDQKLLEERRRAFEKQQSEERGQESGPISSIQQAADNAMDMVDALIENLPSLAEEAVISLTESLPKIIVGAAEALGETLSRIAPLMGDLIKNVVSSLIDALPFILKGAADFVVGLVEGIIEGFIEILERSDEIVGPFIQAIVSAVPRIVAALIKASPRIALALVKSIGLVIFEVFKGLGPLIENIFKHAGRKLLEILTFGLSEMDSSAAKVGAGAIGGAALGAGIGFLAGGPPGALVGTAIGAGIGAIGGAFFHDGGIVSGSLKNLQGAALFAGLGAPGFATGGMVDGIQNAISGSRLRAFRRGVDDVPAVLQAGEAVLNRRAVMNLGEDTISALNSGQSMDSGPTSINVSINPDAGGLNRVVSQLLPHLISGVSAEVDRPGSRLRVSSMNTGRPMGTIRPRRG
tara:strand:- start:1321 stop:8142 length:6822 start_codon:yes stop_codon:yes gene_type:complete